MSIQDVTDLASMLDINASSQFRGKKNLATAL